VGVGIRTIIFFFIAYKKKRKENGYKIFKNHTQARQTSLENTHLKEVLACKRKLLKEWKDFRLKYAQRWMKKKWVGV